LVLDQTRGMETLYFLASRHQDRVLEAFYQGLETLQRQQPKLDQTLRAHRVFTQEILAHKGFEPELVSDAKVVSWREGGEPLAARLARIGNFCDGCVQVIRYRHD